MMFKQSDNRAVFFDRDGVLIATNVIDGKPYAISDPKDLAILPGAKELIELYRAQGYKIIVVTNQPDVGNGKTPQAAVEAMHADLAAQLPIDAIKVCYHRQTDGCRCRKPDTGMFEEAAKELNIELTSSIMIGDRSSDIVAGKKAGCFTIFIDYKYKETLTIEPDLRFASLLQVYQSYAATPKVTHVP
jgi:D-glycero-D-manno-heptose 1,7-bisphosphate phosphatase